MTHEEYLARIDTFADSADDTAAVLAHVGSCARCRGDGRAADRALAGLEPHERSPAEKVVRWSAAAAVLVLVILGFHRGAREAVRKTPAPVATRYRIVGDAAGVVAYTPEGIVVGVVPRGRSSEKEVTK